MALGPGSRLDAYEIVRPLGSGGMGEVWLATDRQLNRHVAIKVLLSTAPDAAHRLGRFEREARASSALSHPNICHIYHLGETPRGSCYIAMEYVEGETLRSAAARAFDAGSGTRDRHPDRGCPDCRPCRRHCPS